MNEKVYFIWFLLVFGVGNIKVLDLIKSFKNVEEAYLYFVNYKNKSFEQQFSQKEILKMSNTNIEEAIKIYEYCNVNNINIISVYDNSYPTSLKMIFNPPLVLFCLGNTENLEDELSLTVVGTRKPSDYSVKVAKNICYELSKLGFTLVSGFALGIDSIVHQAALKNNAKTIAVLGCGIDVDYPKENASFKRIIAQKGAVLSEFLPGTKPLPINFPMRNRILSALTKGTLIIEAAKRSGSVITAELAVEQGKDVFCIPPKDIFDSRYEGVTKYLREGAIPVFSHIDIVYEYYTLFTHKVFSLNNYYEIKNDASILEDSNKKIKVKSLKNNPEEKVMLEKNNDTKIEIDFSILDENQKTIVELLSDKEMHFDDLIYNTNIDVSEMFSLLTELEIMGIINSLAGKMYRLKNR